MDRFQGEATFTLHEPFRPFEQLMGVFPPASSHALPNGYHWLMEDSESPIVDFYPSEILTDPNGKPMPWLWVVLLPFIDEQRLLGAMEPVTVTLSPNEIKRNRRFGDVLIFVHQSDITGKYLVENDSELARGETAPTTLDQAELATVGLTLKATEQAGFSGVVRASEDTFLVGDTIKAPELPKRGGQSVLEDVDGNQAHCVVYSLPPPKPHSCQLLPGAIPPPPEVFEHVRALPFPLRVSAAAAASAFS
jgi:5'-3' exoribonuclease 2